MITIESQLHGYRQGHELLASTITLPKVDQSLVDRLSDASGPLRAGEKFEPYISGYPLPSATHYVLAKTWQDLTVQRAGCVRTLSFLIPMNSWSSASSLEPFFNLFLKKSLPEGVGQLNVDELSSPPFTRTTEFRGSELLEALFLEDSKPVALIDAEDPEIIALRVLTALWPSIRKRFAISTFALSPRRIDGKDFDLVFVPKDARARFIDWPGRRIDGRVTSTPRHRWTNTIVERVFIQSAPQLLTEGELELAGGEEADTSSALRIALLWDELLVRLKESPFAFLGLLDIANSRKQIALKALDTLRDVLPETTLGAVRSLPEAEAWQFVGALLRKLIDTPLEKELKVVASAAGLLSANAPEGAVALLNETNNKMVIHLLTSKISDGISKNFSSKTEAALLSITPERLINLIALGGIWLESALYRPVLVSHFGEIFSSLTMAEIERIKKIILPYILDDNQVKVAEPLFQALDARELLLEVSYLTQIPNFRAEAIIPLLVARASELNIIPQLRDQLVQSNENFAKDSLVFATLTADPNDVYWLFNASQMPEEKIKRFLIKILHQASTNEIVEIFTQEELCIKLLNLISCEDSDLLLKIFKITRLPTNSYMNIAMSLLNVNDDSTRIEVAFSALARGLSERFSGDEIKILTKLSSVIGNLVNGAWIVQEGLNSLLSPDVICRNLIVFNKASNSIRDRILDAVDYLARSLSYRYELDITSEAAEALAKIVLDAQKANLQASVSASAHLLPLILRSTKHPVSKIILVTFPIVYKELAQHDQVPDALRFIPFTDWDKCKAARVELVSAFLKSSEWGPEYLLITACLCQDEERFIKQIRKLSKGSDYIEKLEASLIQIPNQFKDRASHALSKIR